MTPPSTELERWEAAVLGLDLRRHPLSAHRQALGALNVVPGRELREMPHGTRARAAGILESLQAPPTRSGALVHFLLTEDESGHLQSTVFEAAFRRYGHALYGTSAYLLEGRVEQDPKRGFSFVVDRMHDLGAVLSGHEAVPTPRAASSSGAVLKAGRGPWPWNSRASPRSNRPSSPPSPNTPPTAAERGVEPLLPHRICHCVDGYV